MQACVSGAPPQQRQCILCVCRSEEEQHPGPKSTKTNHERPKNKKLFSCKQHLVPLDEIL